MSAIWAANEIRSITAPGRPSSSGGPHTPSVPNVPRSRTSRPRQRSSFGGARSDAQALYERAAADGVPILVEPFDGPFGRTFAMADPDGYRITIYERDQPLFWPPGADPGPIGLPAQVRAFGRATPGNRRMCTAAAWTRMGIRHAPAPARIREGAVRCPNAKMSSSRCEQPSYWSRCFRNLTGGEDGGSRGFLNET